MLETFFGDHYFPTAKEQLEFDVDCINSRSFSLDFIETLHELSKNVIERAYLTEKPILFLHCNEKKKKKSGELIKLYQKGVGENKVTSVELDKEGYFENFTKPTNQDLESVENWLIGLTKEV